MNKFNLKFKKPLFQHETLKSQAQVIANLSGAVVNLALIMLLGRFYEKVAFKLTTWEMHRTQIEFEDNLTFKVFAFQFVSHINYLHIILRLFKSIDFFFYSKGKFVCFHLLHCVLQRSICRLSWKLSSHFWFTQ